MLIFFFFPKLTNKKCANNCNSTQNIKKTKKGGEKTKNKKQKPTTQIRDVNDMKFALLLSNRSFPLAFNSVLNDPEARKASESPPHSRAFAD